MSELSAYVAAEYEGALDFNGKWTGQGKLKYADGIVYNGGFEDGSFHGEGQLTYANGAVYKAIWVRGVEVHGSGSYVWKDGLPYNIPQMQWPYLGENGTNKNGEPFDRRLWPEHKDGVRANVAYDTTTKNESTKQQWKLLL